MSIMPSLEHELTKAAARRVPPGARLRRSGRALALAVVFAAILGGTAGAVMIVSGTIGGPSTLPYTTRAPEPGVTYTAQPVVIATAGRDGWRYELVGYRQRIDSGKPNLCLDIVMIMGGANAAHGCYNPFDHVQGAVQSPEHTLAIGATQERVDRIDVRYTSRGREQTIAAAIAHVDDTAVLDHIDVDEPFTIYVARLPANAGNARVTASYDSGEIAWRAAFPGLGPSYAEPR